MPLMMAAVTAACSYRYIVDGRLAAEDGAVGIECSMVIHDPRLDIVLDDCGIPDPEGYRALPSPIPTGGRFQCQVSGNVDVVYEIRIRCPGYAPLDVPLPVEACGRGFSFGCDGIDLGTLLVRR